MAEIHYYIQKEREVFILKYGSLEIIFIFLEQIKHRMLG